MSTPENSLTVLSPDFDIERQSSAYIIPVISLERAVENHRMLAQFVSQMLREGHDFGKIPGTGDKPTLLKPGAEKLCTIFGLTKRPAIINQTEDWSGAQHEGEPFFYYVYRYGLWRGDMLIAEADGSCNSHESKYRYRKGERVCPDCKKATIRKSKQDDGWYCWKKIDGCGATFGGADPAITGQQVGRVINPDVADLVNTIQKMAQKRALVAATLLAVNASEFFTQDIEDFHQAAHDDPQMADGRRSQSPTPGDTTRHEPTAQQAAFKAQAPAQPSLTDTEVAFDLRSQPLAVASDHPKARFWKMLRKAADTGNISLSVLGVRSFWELIEAHQINLERALNFAVGATTISGDQTITNWPEAKSNLLASISHQQEQGAS